MLGGRSFLKRGPGRAAALVSALLLCLQLVLAIAAPASVAAAVTNGSLALGDTHTCALRSDGTVWCWGAADDGQLGDGTQGDVNFRRLHPVQVIQGAGKLTGVKAITANDHTTCAVKTDGTVWCWGNGGLGELGNNTGGDDTLARALEPVQVLQGGAFLTDVTAIDGGSRHTCALKTNGTVWCWGYDGFAQLGDATLGTGDYQTRLTAVQVVFGSGKLTDAIAISAGGQHSCAIRSGGTVWCWGDDFYGELGDGTRGNGNHIRLKPVQVVQGTGKFTNATVLGAGAHHTCARKSTGTVWCWGSDAKGELGDGTRGASLYLRLKPVRVIYSGGPLVNLTSVSATNQYSCAVQTPGTVWCWGADYHGQLGDGTRGGTGYMRLKALQVVYAAGHLTGVAAIGTGNVHTCAMKSNETVWCWGSDLIGQLGDGTLGDANHNRLKPVQVVGFP